MSRLPASLLSRGWPASLAALALSVWVAGAERAAGEVFVLRSGGRVEGEWINRDESPREKYVVQTAAGGEVTFAKNQVAQVLLPSAEDQAYAKMAPTQPDTIEGHEKMAAWCLEKHEFAKRRDHLERIIALEPNHEEARKALGYRKVGDEWLTRDEEMTAKGLRLYKGRWVTAQEIEVQEARVKDHQAEQEAAREVKRLREALGSASKGEQAAARIRALRNPYAVPAIVRYLQGDEPREIKLLFIEALDKIYTPASLKALVIFSVADPDREVRLTCLDHVVDNESRHDDAVKLYISGLKTKDNAEVNRAASALRQLKNPAAIPALMDVLITEHTFKVGSGNAGQMTSSFSPTGGTSFGQSGPQVVKQKLQNREVLNALIALSGGANYEFDIKAWKTWYANERRSDGAAIRRD